MSDPGASGAVVVNWNGCTLLESCLPTLRRQSEPFQRILVVDNGSDDGSPELLRRSPEVEALTLARNFGFAAAANRGIERLLEDAKVLRVAVLNNDVRLDPDWHRQARLALESDAGVGSCATCLLSDRDADRLDSCGIGWRADGFASNRRHGERLERHESGIVGVWGASAAAALYRRSFLEDVGLFDESFFAYQEDVDLALRGRSRGWRCVVALDARAAHVGLASNRAFPLGGTWADFYNARNRLSMLARSLPGADWRRDGAKILGGHARMLTRSLVEGRAPAVWCGLLHGLLRLPRSLSRRRSPQYNHRSGKSH